MLTVLAAHPRAWTGVLALAVICFGPSAVAQVAGGMVRQPDGSIVSSYSDCAGCPDMVRIPGQSFAMARTYTTAAQYIACVDAGGCKRWENGIEHWASWGSDGPVVYVDFSEAQAFASWLSQSTGRRYHLPTRSEREVAAPFVEPFFLPEWTANCGSAACEIFDNGIVKQMRDECIAKGDGYICPSAVPTTPRDTRVNDIGIRVVAEN
ncbi:MAG: SUMF1/EgtB/PvdO family nonheme iron enzyme [Hyphomonadaceae bacterium]